MSLSWVARKCSPKIIFNAGYSATGAVKTTTYTLRKVKYNTWESSTYKSHMTAIIEAIAESDVFIYNVYKIQCVNTYEGD